MSYFTADFTRFLSERRVVILMIAALLAISIILQFQFFPPPTRTADRIMYAIGSVIAFFLLGLLVLKLIEVATRGSSYSKLTLEERAKLYRKWGTVQGRVRPITNIAENPVFFQKHMIKSILRDDGQATGSFEVLPWVWKRLERDEKLKEYLEKEMVSIRNFAAEQKAERERREQAVRDSYKNPPIA